MKKILPIIALLAATGTQAQVLYVNTGNGAHEQINSTAIEQIKFDNQQQLVAIDKSDGTTSSFATADIDSISLNGHGSALTYSTDRAVAFDAADATSFSEKIETIETDELADEWGDFVENASFTSIINIVFSENKVTCSSTLSDVT